MKSCLIYAFSGTGNSLLLANFLKENLEAKEVKVDIYSIRFPIKDVPDPTKYDMIGLCYPIHGFNAPKPFFKFLQQFLVKLPAKSKQFFIAKQSGEPFKVNSASSSKIVRLMKKKGYELIQEKHFLLSYNIIFKYPDNLRKQMYLYTRTLAKCFVDDLFKNEHPRIKYGCGYRFLSWLFRIEWLAGPLNCKLMHSKKKICTKCGLCVRNCPTGALYFNKKGRIRAHHQCCICMACAFHCPVDAMRTGILNPWRVNGPSFRYKELEKNTELKGDHVNKLTRGYFKHFRKYYRAQNEIIRQHGYEIPVEYNADNAL